MLNKIISILLLIILATPLNVFADTEKIKDLENEYLFKVINEISKPRVEYLNKQKQSTEKGLEAILGRLREIVYDAYENEKVYKLNLIEYIASILTPETKNISDDMSQEEKDQIYLDSAQKAVDLCIEENKSQESSIKIDYNQTLE